MDDVQGHSYVNREVSKSSLSVGVAEGNRIREQNSRAREFRVKTLLGADPVFFRVPWLLGSPK